MFLVAPYGAAARYLLRTEILDSLIAAGTRVIALVPNPRERYLREELGAKGVELDLLQVPDRPTGRVRSGLGYLRQNTLGGRLPKTLALRAEVADRGLRRSHPLLSRLLNGLLALLRRSAALRRGLIRAEAALGPRDLHRELFERHRPSLVVTASPGWFYTDAVVLGEAARRGIRTVAGVVGWDNPTSKGYRGASPDLTLAWSRRMVNELVEHHDLDPLRISVTGVPQFDMYHRPTELYSRAELFSRLGLDPERRLVVFAGRSPTTYAHNLTVAEVLAQASENGLLDEEAQLVVRPHPINFRADHEFEPSHFLALADRFAHVVVDLPVVASAEMSCDVPESDYRKLASLLVHCDVLVNVFSTTTLEAFLVDRPVVLVSDETGSADTDTREAPEARAFRLDTHMEPLVKTGAAAVAHSFDQLVPAVGAALRDPQRGRAARRRIVEQECGPLDGRAGRRAGRLILEQLGQMPERWPADTGDLTAHEGARTEPRPLQRSRPL
ncbi:MAG: CDP-glycerol glycerophosphotransferase family protein [Solirubrobacterales bacterium]